MDKTKWIEDRAYFLWIELGKPENWGNAFWLTAEQEYHENVECFEKIRIYYFDICDD